MKRATGVRSVDLDRHLMVLFEKSAKGNKLDLCSVMIIFQLFRGFHLQVWRRSDPLVSSTILSYPLLCAACFLPKKTKVKLCGFFLLSINQRILKTIATVLIRRNIIICQINLMELFIVMCNE